MRVVLGGVATYKCDFCRRNFSAEKVPHLALQLGDRSGVANPPPNELPGWRLIRPFKERGYHFCLPPDGCLGAFMDTLTHGKADGLREYLQ